MKKQPVINSQYAEQLRQRVQNVLATAHQKSDLLRKLANDRAEEKARSSSLLCLWYICDGRLREYEDIRDSHAPKHPDDPWDDAFCESVRMIPALRELCRDVWFEYCNIDRKGVNDIV